MQLLYWTLWYELLHVHALSSMISAMIMLIPCNMLCYSLLIINTKMWIYSDAPSLSRIDESVMTAMTHVAIAETSILLPWGTMNSPQVDPQIMATCIPNPTGGAIHLPIRQIEGIHSIEAFPVTATHRPWRETMVAISAVHHPWAIRMNRISSLVNTTITMHETEGKVMRVGMANSMTQETGTIAPLIGKDRPDMISDMMEVRIEQVVVSSHFSSLIEWCRYNR